LVPLPALLDQLLDFFDAIPAKPQPADILIQPRLGGMRILDFHRAAPAIAEGRAAVERMMPAIRARLGLE
jgi:predicted acylesterase/phospholipase RssA